MPDIKQNVIDRFAELAEQAKRIPVSGRDSQSANVQAFYAWASSALYIIHSVFGKDSPHYKRLESEIGNIVGNYVSERTLDACRGVFYGAKSDVDGGYVFHLQAVLTGELFGDIVAAAKSALSEGKHAVACVLACAALEDALKRHATVNGLEVEEKTMEEVVNALKGKGLVSGAQKALLSAMPKIRNYAMHADWEKITPQDAASVIGFVEHFLLEHFA